MHVITLRAAPHIYYFEGPGLNDIRYQINKTYTLSDDEYVELRDLLNNKEINKHQVIMEVE